jgi:hypothetical protein
MKTGSWPGRRRTPTPGEGCRCAPAWPPGTFAGQVGKGGVGGKKSVWSACRAAFDQGGKAGNAGKKALARGGNRAVQ